MALIGSLKPTVGLCDVGDYITLKYSTDKEDTVGTFSYVDDLEAEQELDVYRYTKEIMYNVPSYTIGQDNFGYAYNSSNLPKGIFNAVCVKKDKDIKSNPIIIFAPVNKSKEKKEINLFQPIIKEDEREININNIDKNKNDDNDIIIEHKNIQIENFDKKPVVNEDENNFNKNIEINSLKNNKIENEILTVKNNVSMNSAVSSSNKNDYNTRIVDLINKLRTNPKNYSKFILSNIKYINKRVKIIADDSTGQNEEKIEVFFKKKVKIELYRGESAFIDTANYLEKLNPLNELTVKEEIKINTLPETEEQFKDDTVFIKNQISEINKKYNISAFLKDNVKNPEIGLMLMIVGDYKKSQNKKRNVILNPDYKYIAVNSKFFGSKFIAYFTFSK